MISLNLEKGISVVFLPRYLIRQDFSAQFCSVSFFIVSLCRGQSNHQAPFVQKVESSTDPRDKTVIT